MDDLISRQAAIDAISCDITVTGKQNAELVASTIGTFADRIKALPPAQSEILTCEDCKYADDKPISDGRHWCTLHGSFMYYCSDAERR